MSTLKTKKGTELPLINLKGKDYLQVAYRLVWFREEHPDWSIQTEYVHLTPEYALAKATISDPKGQIMATAHKREDAKHFPDFAEKAETGSIGRALALCGYGAQFEPELDEGSRIVDSPLSNTHGVYPEQPDASDGVQNMDRGYVIDFGKFNKKTIEQVMRDQGPDVLIGYINYLEDSAAKQNKPIEPGGKVAVFIEQASAFLGAFENDKGA